MATEIYKGRRIVVTRRRGREGSEFVCKVNGVQVFTALAWSGRDGTALIENAQSCIDSAGDVPDGRWGYEWYDPKTVEPCAEESHPQVIGGPCTYETCIERNTGPQVPCPTCGKLVTRYTAPAYLRTDEVQVTAHYVPGNRRMICGNSNMSDRGQPSNLPPFKPHKPNR